MAMLRYFEECFCFKESPFSQSVGSSIAFVCLFYLFIFLMRMGKSKQTNKQTDKTHVVSIQVWNETRVSKWWSDLNFWLNFPFMFKVFYTILCFIAHNKIHKPSQPQAFPSVSNLENDWAFIAALDPCTKQFNCLKKKQEWEIYLHSAKKIK